MKSIIGRSIAVLTAAAVLFAFMIPAYASGYYIHDPMENPKAAADIVVDPAAVYGYAPDPDSKRLGTFAEYDWSDEAFVAEMRQEREEYHESLHELYQIKADMEAQGKSIEEVARAVSTRRNEIRLEYYENDPEGLEKLKESNLAAYGNENGGTPDYFYAKYGSWETVIEKAFSTNAGADAILGLYDQYYYTYIIDGDEGPTDPEKRSTEDSAAVVTEPATEYPADAVGNPSKISPRTGDPLIVLLTVIITAAGFVLICITVLTDHDDRRGRLLKRR